MSKSKTKISVSTNGIDYTELPENNVLSKAINGEETEKTFLIKDAAIKDDFCNYSYEIISGIGIGDTHSVKGSGIIEDDMRNAFAVFNVHLAVIDDIFKHSKVKISDIDAMHGHDLTGLVNVTGFKIKGSNENESIILVGNKYVSEAGGRIELVTPRIPLDNLSSYKWYKELKVAADAARLEVELYKGGKYTPVVEEEIKEEAPLPNLFAQSDAEFEEAKL